MTEYYILEGLPLGHGAADQGAQMANAEQKGSDLRDETIYRDACDAHAKGASSNAPYVTETHLAGQTKIGMLQIENNPAGSYPDPPLASYSITKQTRGTGHADIDAGASRIKRLFRRDDLLLVPPRVKSFYDIDYTFSLEVISVPVPMLQAAHNVMGRGAEPELEKLHSDAFRDPYISITMSRMFEEARAGGDTSALFVDHAVQSISVALLAQAGRLATQDRQAKPLDDAQLGLITSILLDRLDERVSMDDLAEAIQYDVFRFTRAFKARTGLTPHKFLSELRLDRVEQQLRDTQLPIAEIAYACGFSSQSHMTTAFSNRMGVSPAAFRAEVSS